MVTIFYDGHCGFCHRSVQFVLHHDREQMFRFAPLQGETARRELPDVLPDTIVLRTADGKLFIRSEAWVYILHRLGGFWNLLAAALALVPTPIRDTGYRMLASLRPRFGKPSEICPVLPPDLRARFDP